MIMQNQYELYDRIVAATYTNIFIESDNKNVTRAIRIPSQLHFILKLYQFF